MYFIYIYIRYMYDIYDICMIYISIYMCVIHVLDIYIYVYIYIIIIYIHDMICQCVSAGVELPLRH